MGFLIAESVIVAGPSSSPQSAVCGSQFSISHSLVYFAVKVEAEAEAS